LDLALGFIVFKATFSFEVPNFNPFAPTTQFSSSSPVGAFFENASPIFSLFGPGLGTFGSQGILFQF